MGKSIIEDPKGNSALGKIATKENKEKQADILVKAIVGGFDYYRDLMEKLEKDKNYKLTENQKIYMDKIEKMAEFAVPKRAREDGKGNADTGTKIYLSKEHREEAKKAIQKFLNS